MRAAPLILALLAGCSSASVGGDAGDLVDAGDDAGPVDAATDASPSEVRVLVTSAGAPRAGARVAIHLPDGTSLGPSKPTAAGTGKLLSLIHI